uniref:aECM cysteine-cradle domain-containing protein n=2 Tax=Caenorhabditis japonica TaxID=281687 RepID=A0A8R1DJH5_CAEJA
MWISGVLLLICHYQMASTSKTFMTNEISMLSLGHKENTATFRRLQPKENLPARYRSSRFERLRVRPEDIKPVSVKSAIIETEDSLLASSRPAPIQVIPSSETVTEMPMDLSSPSHSQKTPAPFDFSDFNMDGPQFKDISAEPFPKMITESSIQHSTEKFTTQTSTTQPKTTRPAYRRHFPIIVETSQEPAHIVQEYAQERVYPTAVSVKPDIEFVQVVPSSQIEVVSTNVAEVEETIVTTTKAPKRRRHRRKHHKHRKITKATEAPAEVVTIHEIPTELPTESFTSPSSSPTKTTTFVPPTTTTTTAAFPTVPTFPIVGSSGLKAGESYLGGWNEDEGIIVSPTGPSLGAAMNQFSELPSSIAINDDKAIKEYYEQYYAEWYRKHNQATDNPEDSTSPAPHQIKIGLGTNTKSKNTPSSIEATTGISSSTTEPTKEQLDKVCDYVAKISKSFGIKDLVGFAKNNCSFVKSFHPSATCEQIQHLMQYCVSGAYVTNQ